MKDRKQEKKKAVKADKATRFRFAAKQLETERQRHLELAKQQLEAHRRGIRSFAFAASIKKNLAWANATPDSLGISSDELDDLELELIMQAEEEMEHLRRNPDSTRLLVLTTDMKNAGYSPELLGTTQEELKELNRQAQQAENSKEARTEKFI
ncbi:MAG: hypothetical protein RDU25_05280 [Patescibacteria group bacterium]|nr:hypothetical protein [Patescibacteria group bacterium]